MGLAVKIQKTDRKRKKISEVLSKEIELNRRAAATLPKPV